MSELIIAPLVVGLLGSLHCVGMCGPLAVAVACGNPKAASRRLLLFVLGKATTYATLGAVAGTIGAAVGAQATSGKAFGVLALIAGAGMILFGVHNAWRRLRPARSDAGSAVATLLKRLLGKGNNLFVAPLIGGGLAGLLPCGLVYAMVARALGAGTTWGGALVMVAFGVGTAPSLFAAGWISSRLGGKYRRLGEWLAAAAVVIMGLISIYRGIMVLTAASPEAAAHSCCH